MPTLDLVKTDLVKLQKTVEERTKFYDTEVKGFFASVSPTAITFSVKVWDKFTDPKNPVQRPLTLDEDTAKLARRAARDLLEKAEDGVNVVALRRGVREQVKNEAKSFDTVCDEYLDWCGRDEKQWVKKQWGVVPRIEGWHNYASHLKNARAAFGKCAITEIKKGDIANLLRDIAEKKKKVGLAHNLRTAIYGVFKWASEAGREYCPFNPCVDLPSLGARAAREVALPAEHVAILWKGLDRDDLPCDRRTALALKLVLTTMLRPCELLSLTKAQAQRIVNGAGRVLEVSAGTVKKRRVIMQPVNTLAAAIIEELLALENNSDMLFPAGRDGASLHRDRLSLAMAGRPIQKARRAKGANHKPVIGICKFLGLPEYKPYDLRTTASTLLHIDGRVSDDERARCLDHRKGGTVNKHYTAIDAATSARLRRPTLDILDEVLRAAIGETNVVRLKRAA